MKFKESELKDWEDIARYLANEMEDKERLEFQKRINLLEGNKKLIKDVKSDWAMMKNKNINIHFNASGAWNKLHSRLEKDGLVVEQKSTQNTFNFKPFLRIAAVLMIGAFIAAIAYYLMPEKKISDWQIAETKLDDDIRQIQLNDGSVIHLNAGARLKYPEKFSAENRIVEFEGEAFFDIAHNPEHPFLIKTKNAEIKVLGTSFSINTNPELKDIEVFVETGKVELSAVHDKQISIPIEPGYIGSIRQKEISKIKNTNKNYLSWKTKIWDFTDGVKLGDALVILNKMYDVDIRCKDAQVCETIIRTTFDNKSLDKALELICNAHSLKIEKQNGLILLSK